MTRLTNDPADFASEALAGFIDANPRHVRAVHGGAVRSTKTPQGKVAIVVGGGSGHYPAFAGWVGPGFADGAVAGNIFSSPSAAQAYSVCKAAERGAGVFIGFGNYAGDILHFGQAVERLRSEGIDARTLVVTDDIASSQEHSQRRGIAGDLPTFKVVGAAAEAGADMDTVEALFDKVNHRTRSFGVAFDGCTLPGHDEPLFTVPDGKVGIGLGIHGEPGIDEADLGTAHELAQLLVDGLLKDKPADVEDRAIVIVNGLGDTKYEELFVVYRSVKKLLDQAGIEIVDGEAGEFVTSLDMAGLSLTLVWADQEIEKYWFAACDTPAYRRGAVGDVEVDDTELPTEATAVAVAEQGSEASQQAAGHVVSQLEAILNALKSAEKTLGDADAVAGDGDHGEGMVRGALHAHREAARLAGEGAGAGTTLRGAGDKWSEHAGGTSGALWGAILTAFGSTIGDQDAPDAAAVAAGLAAGLEAVQRLGQAQVGDKTLVDAYDPAVTAAQDATGGDIAAVWAAAAEAAEGGARSTADMVAKLGRARPLGEKSRGTEDPGATSLALVLRTLAG